MFRRLCANDMNYEYKSKSGFVVLAGTLVVGAVGIAVALSLITLGIGFFRSSFALEQSHQAKALADACAEEALEKIRESIPFSGGGNLSFGQGTCSYVVVKLSGQARVISASSTVETTVRKARVTIDKITPDLNITSWQEVADF